MVDGKIVVFTAIFNDYDILLDPNEPSEDIDYICFTEGSTSIDSDIWEERTISFEETLSPKMKAAKVMMFPHIYLSDYDQSVYIDGNIEINGNIERLVKKYLSENKLAVLKHPERNCIYQEAEAVIELKDKDPEKVDNQVKRYREDGFPERQGLASTRVLLRRHNDSEVKELMEGWWKEMKKGVERDQMCFNYVAWKKNFNITYMDEFPSRIHAFPSKDRKTFFSVHQHKPDGLRGKILQYGLPLSYWLERKKGFYSSMKAFRILLKRGLTAFFRFLGNNIKGLNYPIKSLTILLDKGPIGLFRSIKDKIRKSEKELK